MPAGELADAVSASVETFERIARGLDFDIEVSAGHPAPAAPGRRRFPEWAWVHDAWAAVAQAARRYGPTAAPVYAASVEARDLLLRSLEGDLDAWRRDRDRVLELLATMRASCPTPAVAVPVSITPEKPAIRRDTVTAPVGSTPLVTREAAPSRTEGEEPSEIARRMPHNAKRVLKFLWSEGATKRPGFGLTAIEEALEISNGQVRRATDWLRERGLYESGRGQEGGIWLTPLGAQVAEILAKPARG
jgi:hypothetical protein